MTKDNISNGNRRNDTLLLVATILLMLSLILITFKPTMTGFGIFGQENLTEHIFELNKTYTFSTIEQLPITDTIMSIKLTGQYYGEFKIWINNSGQMLLLVESQDSENLGNLLTGLEVLDVTSDVLQDTVLVPTEAIEILDSDVVIEPSDVSNDTLDSNDTISEDVVVSEVTDVADITEIVTTSNSTRNSDAEDVINIVEPIAVLKPVDVLEIDNASVMDVSILSNEDNMTISLNVSIEENVTIVENITTEINVSNVSIEYDITNEQNLLIEENITTEINESNNMVAVEEINDSILTITNETITLNSSYQKITDECIDTCLLDMKAVNVTLIVEVSDNSSLIIDFLKYVIRNTPIENVELNYTNLTADISIETIQYPARVGEPVKWVKRVSSKSYMINVSLEVPSTASNLSLINSRHERKELKLPKDSLNKKPLRQKGKSLDVTITGPASPEIMPDILDTLTNITLNEHSDVVEVEYYTEAPVSVELNVSKNTKEVQISSDRHYVNVTAYAALPFEVSKDSRVDVVWRIFADSTNLSLLSYDESELLLKNGFVERVISSVLIDSDGDSLYDGVEWIAPHLSNQTFKIIIITKADLLDENKKFVQSIFEYVKEKDDVWFNVSENNYVRVTFEQNLTSENDITIYASSNDSGRVLVYEKDSDNLLADFGTITDDKHQIFLTNLTGSQDVFDLQVIDGTVEFDYVVDPVIYPNVLGAATTYGYGWQEKVVRLNSGEMISVWADSSSDLWCSNSLDGGIKWKNTEIADAVTYITPTIVTNGSRIVIFAVDNVTAQIDIVTAYSDAGCSGTFTFVDVDGLNESTGAVNFTYPASATGPDHKISLCAIGNADDLYFGFSEDFGTSFNTSYIINESNNDECDIEVDENGMVWIVTADRGIDDIFLINSSNEFITFTLRAVELGSADTFPSIAFSDDDIYLTWTNGGNNLFRFANSTDGLTWSIQSVSTDNTIVGDTLYSVVKVNNNTGEIYVFYDQDINSAEYAVFLANSSDNGLTWNNRRLHISSGNISTDDAYLTSPRGSNFPASNRITDRVDYTYVDDIGASFEVVFKTIPDNFPKLNTTGLIVTTNTNANVTGYAATRIYDKESGLVSDHSLTQGTYSESARSWQKLRCLEKRNECILLWNDVQNDINFEIYTISDGTWNNYTLLEGATLDDNTRPFDIECEDLSGECLIVYTSDGIQNVTSIAYRIYNDSWLSEEYLYDNITDINGTQEWAELYPKNNTDEMMLIVEYSNLGIYAILWNGTNNSFIESTNLNVTYVGPLADRKSFSFAWEGLSSEGLLVYGKTTDGLFAYTFINYAWQDIGSIYSLGARAYNIDMCGASTLVDGTNHDYIGIIIEDQDSDINGMVWNGTAIESGNPAEDATAEGLTATQYARCMWESQSKDQAVFVWVDTNNWTASAGSYKIGSGWDFTSFEDDNQTGIATFSDDVDSLSMYAHPYSDEIFILGQDIAEDVNFFIWNGTWFDNSVSAYFNPIEVISPNSAFQSETFDYVRYLATISESNTPPNITAIVHINAIDPIESSQRIVEFNFTVNDAQGNDTINLSSANIIINNSEVIRQSSTVCLGIAVNASAMNITCNVSLQYYDPPGNWSINISLLDISSNYTENISTTFTYNNLYAIVLNTNLLDFGSLNAGDVNKTAGTLTLNNTGNFNYTSIQLKAYDLVNGTAYALAASNFRVNMTNASAGASLSNNTFISIMNATLSRSTDSSVGNSSMYIYVDVPLGTAAKKYYSFMDWVLSLS